MTKIKEAFKNGKALIPFVTAGDPNLDVTKELILAMDKNGADIIEIGIPFSDPVAEGLVVQQADERALKAGTTTDKIFDMVKEISSECSCPLAFMTYMNPIFVYGADRFMSKCQECGVSAVIVPDVPFEEKDEVIPYAEKYGIEVISFIAPSSKDRIEMIAKEAQGFLYCICSTGGTCLLHEIIPDTAKMIESAKKVSDVPCDAGFEIETPEQAKALANVADGIIVDSEVVKIVAKYGENSIEPVVEYIKAIKEAIS